MFLNEHFPDIFEYEVNPENQCQGLKIWAKEQGHNRFEGFVQYSDLFKEFYLILYIHFEVQNKQHSKSESRFA